MDIESFADEWYRESSIIAAARDRGAQLPDGNVSPATGGVLRSVATALAAAAVVQAGGDGGVSSLYLLEGMADKGVLTAIESAPAPDQVAREVFREAGTGHRVRPITGKTLDVISRLADHAYDLLVVGPAVTDRAEHLDQARRLLRPGGAAIFLGVFGADQCVLNPSHRDEQTSAQRLFLTEVGDDPSVTASLIPIDNGVLVVFIPASSD
ncbi:MAG: hypothetical protein QG597_3054 [Actinomycetota bacterium]|nr:hypothetical protein [Actinomycetota bacterium]